MASNKSEFIRKVKAAAEEYGYKFTLAECKFMVDLIPQVIRNEVKDRFDVVLGGFGRFAAKEIPEATRNVFGEMKTVPEHLRVSFTPSKRFNDYLNEKN